MLHCVRSNKNSLFCVHTIVFAIEKVNPNWKICTMRKFMFRIADGAAAML